MIQGSKPLSTQVQAAVGCVGAVIMPYNLFLGSAIVLTRPKRVKAAIDKLRTRTVKSYVWVETAVVLLFSLTINLLVRCVPLVWCLLFIILSCWHRQLFSLYKYYAIPHRQLRCLPQAARMRSPRWGSPTPSASWTLVDCWTYSMARSMSTFGMWACSSAPRPAP